MQRFVGYQFLTNCKCDTSQYNILHSVYESRVRPLHIQPVHGTRIGFFLIRGSCTTPHPYTVRTRASWVCSAPPFAGSKCQPAAAVAAAACGGRKGRNGKREAAALANVTNMVAPGQSALPAQKRQKKPTAKKKPPAKKKPQQTEPVNAQVTTPPFKHHHSNAQFKHHHSNTTIQTPPPSFASVLCLYVPLSFVCVFRRCAVWLSIQMRMKSGCARSPLTRRMRQPSPMSFWPTAPQLWWSGHSRPRVERSSAWCGQSARRCSDT